MLSWIAGERPTRVYAELAQRKHAAHEDLLFGLLHFPSGTSGMLDVNWLTPAKRRQLSVVGEEGMFELDYLTQRLTFTRSDLGRPQADRRLRPDVRGRRRRHRRRYPRAAQAQLDAFVADRPDGRPPGVDGEDGAVGASRSPTALLEAAADRPTGRASSTRACRA